MKHIKSRCQCSFLIGMITLFTLFSCSDKKKEKPKEEIFATAHVTIGNGIDFDFKGDKATGISAFKNKLGIGLLDSKKGITMYLAVQAPDGLKEGAYSLQVKDIAETGTTAYLTLSPITSDLLPESFDTRLDLDGDFWNDGTGNITITSLKGNWIEGTFSAVVYSKSGDEAQITDGKFKTEVDYEF